MPSLAQSKRWEIAKYDVSTASLIEVGCGVNPLVARIMAGRNITTVEDAQIFLHPSLDRDWEDPCIIPGLIDVVNRLQKALENHERIAVFGDFDVDGISATCLLTSALRDFGGTVTPFIPKRFDEGYGLSTAALERLIELAQPQLVITVDTGIAGAQEARELVANGIDVAITDHHEPGELVPVGVPVCDPKLDPNCPSRELAGVGVALKIVCELGKRLGFPNLWRSYTDIATLGTVSDMMLLTGENRSLVAEGIERLRKTDRPGLVYLAAAARRDITTMTSDDLAFSIIPRLNAAGRMDDPAIALELLMEKDPVKAQAITARLEDINQERRNIEGELAKEAVDLVDASYTGGRVIVVGGEGWHEGVKGIVASRLVNKYHVPTLLFTISDGMARGSGRSVGDVNLFEALEQCSDLLERFGGHAGAVGVTLEASNLDAFRDRMEEVLSELPEDLFVDHKEIAAQVSMSEMTVDIIDSLSVLQPFGQGNSIPLLAAPCVTMTERRRRGINSQHLSFIANDLSGSCGCIMFNAQEIDALAECEDAIDMVFEPKIEDWQGRKSCKLHVRDILRRNVEDPHESLTKTASFIDDLFDRADEFMYTSELLSLAHAQQFHTKIAGTTFDGRQNLLSTLHEGDMLSLIREPQNPHDSNAIKILNGQGTQIGYIKRLIAAAIAPRMDCGAQYEAFIESITGGTPQKPTQGVNILVSLKENASSVDTLEVVQARQEERSRLAALTTEQITQELKELLIGHHNLLPAQAQALKQLESGKNTLCVMATGRGKSLIFHVHAARCALLDHRASIFVYPLRALVSDQAFHLSKVFDQLGMTTRTLTGETGIEEREALFAALAEGNIDILLTTPEFLTIHANRFAEGNRIGFLVIDEAHHAGQAKGGTRTAYLDLPRVIEALNHPTTLAVTATADNEVTLEIMRLLQISRDGIVIDNSERANLSICDERNLPGRDDHLVSLLASGEKTLVYVNSREQTVTLARILRKRVRERAHRVAFYNGGLLRSDRATVEDAFREGDICLVVSTSAFGEGVNLPDVRHVVLYHLPFDEVEFNQMSGRAGRDGHEAHIHLAYSQADARINERLLAGEAPQRDDLVTLYRVLQTRSRGARLLGDVSFAATNAELAGDCAMLNSSCSISDKGVSSGIGIFRELGFVLTSGYGVARRIEMVQSPNRMDLTGSIRYCEGIHALEAFNDYRQWALEAPAQEILSQINKPIVPSI
ncbi:MAG: single-stranded-DNA-specific exonuclease RecJ [Coriobacteriales bacterium]|nr:single-stranded-DNA-specific exonuclease RecJ [Coriobacteriales bacterium]